TLVLRNIDQANEECLAVLRSLFGRTAEAAFGTRIIMTAEAANSSSERSFEFDELVHIELPPLRGHPEDIAKLIPFLLKELNDTLGSHVAPPDEGLLRELCRLSWFGEVARLRDTLRLAVARASEPTIFTVGLLDETMREEIAALPPAMSSPSD